MFQVPSNDGGDGGEAAVPTTNVPPAKKTKEKGQGKKERRAKAKAEAEGEAAGESGASDALGDAASSPTVGAFAHVSRLSDDDVDHPERFYKPGQKVGPDELVD